MLTIRPIEKDGKWGQKSRTENGVKIPTVGWNNKDKAEQWRQAWGDICNEYLLRNERAERIDHRSFKRQGKEKLKDEVKNVEVLRLGVESLMRENEQEKQRKRARDMEL